MAPRPSEETNEPAGAKGTEEVDESRGSGRNGQFLGEDLAKLVTLSSRITNMTGGKLISERDLEDVLSGRLGKVGYGEGSTEDGTVRTRDISEVIIDSLPKELRTQEVIQAIDLRPYLVALNGKTIVQRTDGMMFGETAETWKVNTTELLEQQQASVESDFMALQGDSTLSDDEKKRIVKESTALNGTVVDLTPAAQQNAPAVAAGTATSDLLSAGQAALGGQGFPVEGMTEALQSGMMDFENLVLDETAQNEALGGGFYPMNLGPEGPTTMSGGPGGNSIDRGQAPPQQYAGPTQMMSAAKAKNWLSTLTEKEVANLQMKMAAAGYFDRVDGGAAYLEGDAYDPITIKAWTMLLTETAQQKEAMPMVLARNMRDYRAKRQQANMRQLNEFDATMSRVQANDFSKSVIGRGLSSTEAQALEEFLLGLREQRSGYVAGAVNPAGQLPNADGYDNRDIESFINRNNGDEQMSNYQGELLYTMNKRFGG